MLEKRYWIDLKQKTNQSQKPIQKYLITQLNNSLRNLPLNCFFTAASQYSGPIALLYDSSKKTQYTFSQQSKNSISIFSNKGQIKKIIPFQVKEKIIAFQFLQDQSLLIINNTGQFYQIDPFSGFIKKSSFLQPNSSKQKERFIGTSIIRQNVFTIKEKQFGVVRNIGKSVWQAINQVKVNVLNPVFEAFQQQNTIKVIYLSRDDTIQIFDFQTGAKTTLMQTEFLKANANKLLTLSKKDNKIAIAFEKPYRFIIKNGSQISKHEPMINIEQDLSNQKESRYIYKRKYDFGWIGDCVAFSNKLFAIIYNEQKMHMSLTSQKLVFEVDGVRSYGEQHYLYRQVPEIYRQLVNAQNNQNDQFLDQSLKPLHKFYWQHLNKEVVKYQQINFKVEFIEECLRKIILCGGLCLDILQQMKIFKFASFIKLFYKASTDVNEVCKQLRIINNLKYEYLNRAITLAQYRHIKNNQSNRSIILLLRYNMHFVADQMINDSQGKQKIFLHWAKCKIQKEDQQSALQHIKDKYSSLSNKIKGTKVFTQIARYCLDRNKVQLANSLIQFQQHPGRKIMVSLLIITIKQQLQYVQKLLQFVENCGDSFLMFRVIHQLVKSTWLDQILWTNNLYNRPNLQRHYISYLKQNKDDQRLRKYYLDNKMLEDIGLWALKLDINLTEYELRQKISTQYKALLPFASAILQKQKGRGGNLSRMDKLRILRDKNVNEIKDVDLQVFNNQDQLQYGVQILLSKNMKVQGLKMLRRMKSLKMYNILHRKGQYQVGIQLASQRKDKDGLQFLLQRCPQNLQERIKQQLSKLKK